MGDAGPKSKESTRSPAHKLSIDQTVGLTLKALRQQQSLTIRALGKKAGISEAMISRIESGRVSPSLSTLNALGEALSVPVVNLFRDTAKHADVTHVKAGKGLASRRLSADFAHNFQSLGFHKQQGVRFEPYMITLASSDQEKHKAMSHDDGCEFIYVVEGEMIFRCGDRTYHLETGDSLSYDTMAGRGLEELLSPVVRYLVVFSQRS